MTDPLDIQRRLDAALERELLHLDQLGRLTRLLTEARVRNQQLAREALLHTWQEHGTTMDDIRRGINQVIDEDDDPTIEERIATAKQARKALASQQTVQTVCTDPVQTASRKPDDVLILEGAISELDAKHIHVALRAAYQRGREDAAKSVALQADTNGWWFAPKDARAMIVRDAVAAARGESAE